MQQQWHFWVNWKLIVLFCYQESQMIIFSPFDAIFNELTNSWIFDLYAASMQQRAAAGAFWGIFCNSCLFLIQIPKSWICIHSVQFLMKKPMYSILACMQQICCRMQQHWFFGVYMKMIVCFYHELSEIIIFSPF